MRLWPIFGDAAETDMRCGSDGGKEKGKNFPLLLQHVFLLSPSAHRTHRKDGKPQRSMPVLRGTNLCHGGRKKPTRRKYKPRNLLVEFFTVE